jgi:hypothetical protein
MMETFKMIVYPFGLAIFAVGVVMVFAMVVFGREPADWANWQNQTVSTLGTIVGFGASIAGLWLAIRTKWQAQS